jgi:hypothetical protein
MVACRPFGHNPDCSVAYGQNMTNKLPVRLPIDKIAAHRLKTEGNAISDAYKAFLTRLIRQQKVIDELKRICGVR